MTEIQTRIIHQEVPRDYRTEIPNIVAVMLEEGLITGSDFLLYYTYRKIAGENGACWYGTRALAKKCGLSHPTIAKSKKVLSSPFDILGGKSLIEITPCDRKKEEADIITILDIWPENYAFFKKRLTCEKIEHTGVQKEDTRVCKNTIQKKEPFKKEPNKEGTVCVAAPPVADSPPDKASILLFDGKKLDVSMNDIFTSAIQNRFDWSPEEITEVFKVLAEYQKPVRDWVKFCKGTIENQRKLKKIKELEPDKWNKKPSQKSPKMKTPSEDSSMQTLAPDMKARPLANWKELINFKPRE